MLGGLLEWIFEELFRGLFEFLGETIWKRLPRPARIGCVVIPVVGMIAVIIWLAYPFE